MYTFIKDLFCVTQTNKKTKDKRQKTKDKRQKTK